MKKLIKRLVLKYLEKYVGKEFTQMDNRVYDIEVKLGIHKSEHDAGSKYVGDMAVKDAEHLKGAKEPHFLELPKRWRIQDCEAVSEWAFINYKTGRDVMPERQMHVNDLGICFFEEIDESYTEISFSDFERLVLKNEEVQKIDFSVPGQLLISNQDSMIILTTGVHNKRNETFQGTTVSTHSSVTHKGEHWKQWSKEGFKIFNGSTCLKN